VVRRASKPNVPYFGQIELFTATPAALLTDEPLARRCYGVRSPTERKSFFMFNRHFAFALTLVLFLASCASEPAEHSAELLTKNDPGKKDRPTLSDVWNDNAEFVV